MKDILLMGKEELLNLAPTDVLRPLTSEEFVHIAKVLNAFWSYDYAAADAGRAGMHAILKSGLHSDGFFVSKILLEPDNITTIMAMQITRLLVNHHIQQPNFVVGIPDGATKLGKIVTSLLGECSVQWAEMVKVDGRLVLQTELPPHALVLLVEDFCTRGTGFIEAVRETLRKQPTARFVIYDPVLLNRGGLKEVVVEGVGPFQVLPVVEKRINDWQAEDCPLCKRGSEPIKPKITDENWRLITGSQLEQSQATA